MLEATLTPPQRKTIATYHSSNHRLVIETRQWTIIPISRDTRICHFCHFCSYNTIENEAQFVLECSLYNPIRDKFPSLFENVVPRGLKYFFHLEHQVSINLYLLRPPHSATLVNNCFETILMYNPISFVGFPAFKINFISFTN